MPAPIDLTNKTFGRLLVLRKSSEKNRFGKILWECYCDPELGGCGKTTKATTSHLNSGSTTSCGCLAIEVTKETNTKHGYTKHPEYKVWNTMKDRCYKETHKNYPRYGGRGIKMSDEWKNSFEAFIRDMGFRPDDTYTIERQNNDGDYCKENCHWATRTEQANNRRSNVFYEYNGKRQTLPDWCKELGLKLPSIEQRIRALKMTFEQAITMPSAKEILYTYNGRSMNLGRWCKELGLNYNVMDARIRKLGLSLEEAINLKPINNNTEYALNGVVKSLKEWCIEYGLKVPYVAYRLYRGWSLEQALKTVENTIIEIEGQEHTLEHWCGLYGLDTDKVYLRVVKGEDFKEILKEQ